MDGTRVLVALTFEDGRCLHHNVDVFPPLPEAGAKAISTVRAHHPDGMWATMSVTSQRAVTYAESADGPARELLRRIQKSLNRWAP